MQQIIEKIQAWNALYASHNASNKALEERVALLRQELAQEERRLAEVHTAEQDMLSAKKQDILPALHELAMQAVERELVVEKRKTQDALFDPSYVAGEEELILVYEASTTALVRDSLDGKYREALEHQKTRASLDIANLPVVDTGFVFVPLQENSFDIYTTILFDRQTQGSGRTLSTLLGEIILDHEVNFEERNQEGLLVIHVQGEYDRMFGACNEKNIPAFEETGLKYSVLDTRFHPAPFQMNSEEDVFISMKDVQSIIGFTYTALYDHLAERGGFVRSRTHNRKREVSYESLLEFLRRTSGSVVYTAAQAIERVIADEAGYGVAMTKEECAKDLAFLRAQDMLRFISIRGEDIIGEPELLRVWKMYQVQKKVEELNENPSIEETAHLFRKTSAFVRRQITQKKFTFQGDSICRESLYKFVHSHAYGMAGNWMPLKVAKEEIT